MMNDLVLYIFKQKDKGQVQFTFVLAEKDRPPLTGVRVVDNDTIKEMRKAVGDIVQANHSCPSDVDYVQYVGGQIHTLSELLRERFWPRHDGAFDKQFAKLERGAAKEPTHLLIASNDSSIPWWITQAKGAGNGQLISDYFGVGIISLRRKTPEPKRDTATIELRVVTCACQNLAKDTNLSEVHFDDLKKKMPNIVNYKLLSGRREKPPGLASDQVKKAFKDARILVYHGHFDLHKRKVTLSSIPTSGPPRSRSAHDKLLLKELSLGRKDLIFAGCSSAGMSPYLDEMLNEYLAEQNSTLVGSLYPIDDSQARLFTRKLANCLFRNHLSWGESVRRARFSADSAKWEPMGTFKGEELRNAKLFLHGAFCYFGVPWHMSPLFGARKELRILLPAYLKDVYKLVRPKQVFSTVIKERFVKPAELAAALKEERAAAKKANALFLAALPSVFVNDLLARNRGNWKVLGPLVSSMDDVFLVARNNSKLALSRKGLLEEPKVLSGLYKGSNLTASAFIQVLFGKWKIPPGRVRWQILETDCAPAISAGLGDVGLVVAREDLQENQDYFRDKRLVAADTILAKEFYGGNPIPRILWVTNADSLSGNNSKKEWEIYFVEFFTRMSEKMGRIQQPHIRNYRSGVKSKLWLYPLDKEQLTAQARQTLFEFLGDWTRLRQGKRKRVINEADFHNLFKNVTKQ